MVLKFVYLIAVTILRYEHAGRICSGDYMNEAWTVEMGEIGILGVEGQFLVVYIFFGWMEYAIIAEAIIIIWLRPETPK